MTLDPSLRFDSLTQEWISFSPRRAKRPHQFGGEPGPLEDRRASCPFCPGNEGLTTEELLRIGSADHWRVRVVSNLFPAFRPISSQVARVDLGEPFREHASAGAHEVVVESPDHFDDLRQLPLERVEDLLRALHSRYCSLARTETVAAVVVFKNKGAQAGTSLRHPHWQIIGTPLVPPLVERKLSVAKAHFQHFGRCVYSEMLKAEERSAERLVESTSGYVAFAPFASSVPFQVTLLPRVRHTSWEQLSFEEILPLAELLPSILRRLDAALGDPDFNITITCAPPGVEDDGSFCWHIDVLPRTTVDGGFELASGMKINSVLPELAAATLREAE